MATRKNIPFLNSEISINELDLKDPMFVFLIADIEFKEKMHGQGLVWLNHLANNYRFRLHDESVIRQIREILGGNNK